MDAYDVHQGVHTFHHDHAMAAYFSATTPETATYFITENSILN
jgi:hypothetical protein